MGPNEMLHRYQQADKWLKTGVSGFSEAMIENDMVYPYWSGDSSFFWYQKFIKGGKQFRIVDVNAQTNIEAFDHLALANALGSVLGVDINYLDLPINNIVISLHQHKVLFNAFGKSWQFDVERCVCQESEECLSNRSAAYGDDLTFLPLPLASGENHKCLNSPDDVNAVFLRDHNIWIRNQATGEETALTRDGDENCFYGGMGKVNSGDVVVSSLWSPDSARLLIARWDSSKVESQSFFEFVPYDGSLGVKQHKMSGLARSGSADVETVQLFSVEISTGEILAVDYPAMPAHYYGPMANLFRSQWVWWASDSRQAFFIDLSRDGKTVRVIKWDTNTSKTTVLFEEKSDTYIKLRHNFLTKSVLLPLPGSDELIWFSERSGWTHLYLYDTNDGRLKNTITSGDWLVRDVLHFDPTRRELLIQTVGRDSDVNPYYKDICRVNVDSGELLPLVSGNFDYHVNKYLDTGFFLKAGFNMLPIGQGHAVSPSGQYIVCTRSRVDTLPETILLDRDGREVLTVEVADGSGLPQNWCWPESVKLEGADGETDVYGVVFRPPGFSAEKRYPVVEFVSSTREFSAMPVGPFGLGDCEGHGFYQACTMAALGFICVIIDGRGTPYRRSSFSNYRYGNHRYTGSFEDRIAGIRQLAERYPSMDISRVGIVNSENMTNGIFSIAHSDFYKVAVHHNFYDARYGNALVHDIAEGTAGGVFTDNPEDNVELLRGKMLLVQGLISPFSAATSRLVDALHKANKDFDMLCLPSVGHDMENYAIRRGWDYLVKHLMDEEPPFEYELVGGKVLFQRYAQNRLELDNKVRQQLKSGESEISEVT